MFGSLHLHCHCGGELTGENLTPEMHAELLEKWRRDHDGPDCHNVGAFQAHLKRWADFFDELDRRDGS